MYGVVSYDQEGKPICELCGRSFHRLLRHVRVSHEMTPKKYRKMFGLDNSGILSMSYAKKSRETALKNYEQCIAINLNIKGKATQFKKGNKGLPLKKLAVQTRIKQIEGQRSKIADQKGNFIEKIEKYFKNH